MMKDVFTFNWASMKFFFETYFRTFWWQRGKEKSAEVSLCYKKTIRL